jgi:hypothetical protein
MEVGETTEMYDRFCPPSPGKLVFQDRKVVGSWARRSGGVIRPPQMYHKT